LDPVPDGNGISFDKAIYSLLSAAFLKNKPEK
jgi:hypothetical protein